MQSILQYYTFRRNLQEQIQRHGLEKVASCTSRGSGAQKEVGRQTSALTQSLPRPSASGAYDHATEEKELQNDGQQQAATTSDHVASSPLDDVEKNGAAADADDSTSSSNSDAGYETEVDREGHDLRTTGTRLGQWMTGVSVRSRMKHVSDANRHVFVVGFQGDDDPLNPHNWPFMRRVAYTFLLASIALIVGFASSVDSAAIPQAQRTFAVSEVTESLATGLYLIGFGFGAFFAAPISETVGRNPVYLVTGLLFMIFVMASALAPNIGAQLVFRLLAGFFGSTPLTCAGGTLSDMWNASERTMMFPVFANAAFTGPVLGPIVGGWIAQSSALSWRWCEWITLIWSALIFGTAFLFMPETYAPVLLKWKAEHLRRLTGDGRYMSELEVQDTKFWERLLHNLYRPFILFAYEPIVVLITLYLTVVYIVLFTFLTGFEFIFTDTYGLSQGLTFTIFAAVAVGFMLSTALVPAVVQRYNKNLKQARDEGRSGLPPESRLLFAMIGAPCLPIGLFWMAWTTYSSVSVWSPITANLPVGFGILCIFISSYQYLIDAFERYAASALVGATFIRYVVAGGMIPVSIPFYENVGVHWTLSILAAISLVMMPVPFVFYKFGATIRKKSRHAVANE